MSETVYCNTSSQLAALDTVRTELGDVEIIEVEGPTEFATLSIFISDLLLLAGIRLWDNPMLRLGCNNSLNISDTADIGRYTLVGSGSVIYDSVNIGKRCSLARLVTVCEGVTIGNDCVIGYGSVITKDLPRGTFIEPLTFA